MKRKVNHGNTISDNIYCNEIFVIYLSLVLFSFIYKTYINAYKCQMQIKVIEKIKNENIIRA